uniref:Uncharacterized protein n=1 Tax=Ascaris lumbricoides TaxID=6252 RepID=A0A0M3HJS5_ASCLU
MRTVNANFYLFAYIALKYFAYCILLYNLIILQALDLQYRWGIESLHTQIPQIQVQLVFKEQRLQLRPPIEEIRAKYYREMKKFLSIPQKFRGIQDTEQVRLFRRVHYGRRCEALSRLQR